MCTGKGALAFLFLLSAAPVCKRDQDKVQVDGFSEVQVDGGEDFSDFYTFSPAS